jgi:hypothetical protein
MTTASILTSFWGNLEENHEQAVFLVLVGFLGSFAFIRMSTRIIRSESDSGVHLHHLVFGIVTMMVAGTLGFASDGRAPFIEICALGFGIGVGLTIDEYALWVHLEDVYWAEEGRSSVDATVIAASLMLLIVLGVSPVVIDSSTTEALITSIVLTVIAFICVMICFAKGRILHGTVGIFVAPIAFYGAGRIGKPRSAWARYRYGERRPRKQSKAEDRFAPERRTERFKEAFRDLVGGKPSEGLTAIGDEAVAATREASAEVLEQAERLAHAADPRESKERD